MTLNSLTANSSSNSVEVLNDCIVKFNTECKDRESFLTCDTQKSKQFIDLTKRLFDLNKRLISEKISKNTKLSAIKKKSLNELFTDGFDEEQVWQQIQLQNEPLLDQMVKEVAVIEVKGNLLGLKVRTDESIEKKTNKKSNVSEKSLNESTDGSIEAINDLMSEEDESDDDSSGSEAETEPKRVKAFQPMPKSSVDDKFFSLHEMKRMLDNEDLKEEQKNSGTAELMSEESDEDIDYFVDSEDSSMSGDEELTAEPKGREAMFKDFFDPPIDGSVEQMIDDSKGEMEDEEDGEEDEEEEGEEIDTRDVDINDLKERDNESGSELSLNESIDSDSEEDPFSKASDKTEKDDSNPNKSEFERIQDLLKEKIAKQERENLSDKSWQMSGEVVADKRPENSLLEEHLQFDHTTRPAPLITEETTGKLEDIIRQRVKDNAFDDVTRKVKPKELPFEYRRRITMESEKSKQSLSQIYENEYQKQQQKEREEKEDPEETVIKKLMRTLFVQLDALSNFHFTPRPPQPDIKIINNLPAITAEEVTPVATSDVTLLAPQEVFNNQKRELQTNAEKSSTDRKRARRLKKKVQSNRSKYNDSKEIAKKKSKESAAKSGDVKHLSSSKQFFDKLQEKTTQMISKTKSEKKISNKTPKESNKLKL